MEKAASERTSAAEYLKASVTELADSAVGSMEDLAAGSMEDSAAVKVVLRIQTRTGRVHDNRQSLELLKR